MSNNSQQIKKSDKKAPGLSLRYTADITIGGRDSQQDAIGISNPPKAFVVADGMGGMEGGEVASKWVIDAVCEAKTHEDIPKLLAAVNARIKQMFKGGSTVVAAFIEKGICHIYSAGDSRAYYNGKQVTKDHNLPGRQNVLLNAVGVHQELTIDHVAIKVNAGDKMVLCSDGAYSHLEDDSKVRGLKRHENVGPFVQAQKSDNCSVILVTFHAKTIA